MQALTIPGTCWMGLRQALVPKLPTASQATAAFDSTALPSQLPGKGLNLAPMDALLWALNPDCSGGRFPRRSA